MALIDRQRAWLAACFREHPDACEQETWLVYRELVRERMWKQLQIALPRTWALVDDSVLERSFAWHLEHEPPRTRYFRALVAAFVASALPLWAADANVPAAAGELMRYELALWELADRETHVPEYREFAFEALPVLSPALELFRTAFAVHTNAPLTPGDFYLCLQRESDTSRPRIWTLTATTYGLLQQLARGDATVSEIVKRSAGAIDAGYLDALCATLAQFLESGILLGSR